MKESLAFGHEKRTVPRKRGCRILRASLLHCDRVPKPVRGTPRHLGTRNGSEVVASDLGRDRLGVNFCGNLLRAQSPTHDVVQCRTPLLPQSSSARTICRTTRLSLTSLVAAELRRFLQ